MSRLVLFGSAVLLLLLIGLVVVAEIWADWPAVQRWVPNFAAELAGIILTLVVINALLDAARQRRIEPQRVVALSRVKTALMDFAYALMRMYKASAQPGSPTYATPIELLNSWAQSVRALDLYADAPIVPKRTWLIYLAEELGKLAKALEELTDRHAEALGTDFVVASERYLGSPFRRMVTQFLGLPAADAEAGFDRPSLLAFHNMETQLKAFASTLAELFGAYEALSGERLEYVEGTWRDDESPGWGDARGDRPEPLVE